MAGHGQKFVTSGDLQDAALGSPRDCLFVRIVLPLFIYPSVCPCSCLLRVFCYWFGCLGSVPRRALRRLRRLSGRAGRCVGIEGALSDEGEGAWKLRPEFCLRVIVMVIVFPFLNQRLYAVSRSLPFVCAYMCASI